MFRGSLAIILAEQNNIEEAFSLFERGEPHVTNYPLEHGKFLCKKAKVLHIDNQREKAKKVLQQAKEISEKLKVTANSELAKAITETQGFLARIT